MPIIFLTVFIVALVNQRHAVPIRRIAAEREFLDSFIRLMEIGDFEFRAFKPNLCAGLDLADLETEGALVRAAARVARIKVLFSRRAGFSKQRCRIRDIDRSRSRRPCTVLNFQRPAVRQGKGHLVAFRVIRNVPIRPLFQPCVGFLVDHLEARIHHRGKVGHHVGERQLLAVAELASAGVYRDGVFQQAAVARHALFEHFRLYRRGSGRADPIAQLRRVIHAIRVAIDVLIFQSEPVLDANPRVFSFIGLILLSIPASIINRRFEILYASIMLFDRPINRCIHVPQSIAKGERYLVR